MRHAAENFCRVEFPAKSVNESFARTLVSAFLAQYDPTINELCDLKTAVSEAVTNAIVHGYREAGGKVYISIQAIGNRRIRITVKDHGCGIPDIAQAMQPLFTTDTSGERGGMGFAVMQSFTDKLKVSSKPNKGTTVTMEKTLKG